jgi:hypothetical protein
VQPGEIFEFDRDELDRGIHVNSLTKVRARICNAALNIFLEFFLIAWLIFFFRQEMTAPIYWVEKYWMISWIIPQMMSY